MRVSCPRSLAPGPGQAVLAHKPGSQDPLRHPLFPIHVDEQGFSTPIPEGVEWSPGSRVDLWGPFARGFQPPPASSRWLLASRGAWSGALFPLIELGLQRSCAVALRADDVPLGLPKEVEVITDLLSAVAWADYLAAEVTAEDLPKLRQAIAPAGDLTFPEVSEVLIRTALPCGFGACGACSVPTRRSRRLACLEGPVFNFKTLGW